MTNNLKVCEKCTYYVNLVIVPSFDSHAYPVIECKSCRKREDIEYTNFSPSEFTVPLDCPYYLEQAVSQDSPK